MKLRIRHQTRYTYTEPVTQSVQSLHLWPANGPWQTVLRWALRSPATLHGRMDALGNHVHHGSVAAGRNAPGWQSLVIEAEGVVQTLGVADWCEPASAPHPMLSLRSTPMAEPHPRMAAWATTVMGNATEPLAADGRPTPTHVLQLASAVADKVAYRKGRTVVNTSALEAFDWELGVCQDQAHVMVAVCRSLGWPARYVSGYFFASDEPELASHAWAEVCVDVATRRWICVDVTHRCLTDTRHVRLATGTDYSACPPVKGLRHGGGKESMDVAVSIQPA